LPIKPFTTRRISSRSILFSRVEPYQRNQPVRDWGSGIQLPEEASLRPVLASSLGPHFADSWKVLTAHPIHAAKYAAELLLRQVEHGIHGTRRHGS